MANSVIQDPFGVDWPLGFVTIATPGTPINMMANVDPGLVNAPGKPTGPGLPPAAEFSPRCHRIQLQGFHPSGTTGMIANTKNAYVMRAPGPNNQFAGGAGNYNDPGAIVAIVPAGQTVYIPALETDQASISPYRYTLDADVAGEGALVTLLNCGR